MSLRGRKNSWRAILLLVLAVVLLYPFESMVAPARNVLVITEDSRAVQGAKVRQIWQNYSIETTGHEEDSFTGEDGRVSFPRRTIRATLLWRGYRVLANVLTQGVHASFGPRSDILYLTTEGEKPTSTIVESQPQEVVFRRS